MVTAYRPLKEIIAIKQLISIHYFEFSKDFVFDGEMHNFWEIAYIDKGEAMIKADSRACRLTEGDMIFHKPDEFHSIEANKQVAPNIVVISFECKSEAMAYFHDKCFTLDTAQRNRLAHIMQLSYQIFEPPFNDPKINRLKRKTDEITGGEQLIKLNLELLLLELLQSGYNSADETPPTQTRRSNDDEDLIKQMVAFMKQNVTRNFTLEQICSNFNFSKSHAVTLFRVRTGTSIVKYYKTLIIEEAKQMIREGKYNFTQIAEILNYSSIFNFSRQFKSITDMTPSEYAKTIQAKLP